MSFVSSIWKSRYQSDNIVQSAPVDNIDSNFKEDKKSDTSSFSVIDTPSDQLISNGESSHPSTIIESSSSSDLDQPYTFPSNPTLAQYLWYYYYQTKFFLRKFFASPSTRVLISIIVIPFVSGFVAALIRRRHRFIARS